MSSDEMFGDETCKMCLEYSDTTEPCIECGLMVCPLCMSEDGQRCLGCYHERRTEQSKAPVAKRRK